MLTVLRDLEYENSRLKQIYADLSLAKRQTKLSIKSQRKTLETIVFVGIYVGIDKIQTSYIIQS